MFMQFTKKLNVILDPEKQVKMTVGLEKTRNSTNALERIDFRLAVNVTPTADENESLTEEGILPYTDVVR